MESARRVSTAAKIDEAAELWSEFGAYKTPPTGTVPAMAAVEVELRSSSR